MVDINEFLKALKESDFYIESIYTHGGCYQLYKIIKTIFPEAKPYIKDANGFCHVATLIGDSLYDINGFIGYLEDYNMTFFPMTEGQKVKAEDWSFAGNNDLYFGECPVCEEPIRIDRSKLVTRKYDN